MNDEPKKECEHDWRLLKGKEILGFGLNIDNYISVSDKFYCTKCLEKTGGEMTSLSV